MLKNVKVCCFRRSSWSVAFSTRTPGSEEPPVSSYRGSIRSWIICWRKALLMSCRHWWTTTQQLSMSPRQQGYFWRITKCKCSMIKETSFCLLKTTLSTPPPLFYLPKLPSPPHSLITKHHHRILLIIITSSSSNITNRFRRARWPPLKEQI